jgi:hypothetical protein
MIISFEDFKTENRIPGLHPIIGTFDELNCVKESEINMFIEKYEPLYLYDFYFDKDVVNALEAYTELDVKTDTEKNVLIESFRQPIANYVAYWYFREQETLNTSIGGANPQIGGAIKVSTIDRQVKLWTEMVRYTRSIYIDLYTSCFFPQRDIFHLINSFNI